MSSSLDIALNAASWIDSVILLVWGIIDLRAGHKRDGGFLLALGVLALAIGAATHYNEIALRRDLEQARLQSTQAAKDIEQMRTQNLELQRDVEAERGRRLVIEARLAPRVLTGAQRRNIEMALRAYSGHRLVVDIQPEPETQLYGDVLVKALRASEWQLEVRPRRVSSPLSIYGVYIGSPNPDSEEVQAIVAQLVDAGNPVYVEKTNDAYDFLAVNLRPAHGLDPKLMLTDRDPAGWRLPQGWR